MPAGGLFRQWLTPARALLIACLGASSGRAIGVAHVTRGGHVTTIVAVTTAHEGTVANDLITTLRACGADVTVQPTASAGLAASNAGDLLMLLADGYPYVRTAVPAGVVAGAAARGVNLFVEFPEEGAGWGMPGGGQAALCVAGLLTSVELSE